MNELKVNDNNKNILSFAFGPGLTLESMLLKICHHSIPVKKESTSVGISKEIKHH